jgi:hypothetical protein
MYPSTCPHDVTTQDIDIIHLIFHNFTVFTRVQKNETINKIHFFAEKANVQWYDSISKLQHFFLRKPADKLRNLSF